MAAHVILIVFRIVNVVSNLVELIIVVGYQIMADLATAVHLFFCAHGLVAHFKSRPLTFNVNAQPGALSIWTIDSCLHRTLERKACDMGNLDFHNVPDSDGFACVGHKVQGATFPAGLKIPLCPVTQFSPC